MVSQLTVLRGEDASEEVWEYRGDASSSMGSVLTTIAESRHEDKRVFAGDICRGFVVVTTFLTASAGIPIDSKTAATNSS